MRRLLSEFPYPPSSNNMHPTIRTPFGGMRRVKSKELQAFEREVNQYCNIRYQDIESTRVWLNSVIQSDSRWLKVHTYFVLPRAQIFTKKGSVKKNDPTNRVKAIHDALSAIFGIDDRLFVGGDAEKIVSTSPFAPCTHIVIEPVPVRTDALKFRA